MHDVHISWLIAYNIVLTHQLAITDDVKPQKKNPSSMRTVVLKKSYACGVGFSMDFGTEDTPSLSKLLLT